MAMIRKCIGDIIETDVDDETIVVQLQTGDMYSLGGIARTIWKILDREGEQGALVDRLTKDHDAERETIARDLADFCREMRSAGLISTA